MVDLNILRNAEHKHDLLCPDCGVCLLCTVPHFCCCGACGHRCTHDHPSMTPTGNCHWMEQIPHEQHNNPQHIIVMDEASEVDWSKILNGVRKGDS